MIKTKIICTMGPSVNRYEKILELIDAGMNVARLNFSHGTHEDHLRTIDLLKKARKEKNVSLAIMLDTKGPEIRIGTVPGGFFEVISGETFYLSRPSFKKTEHEIVLTPELVFDFLEIGTTVLFDDGYIVTKVVEITKEGVFFQAQNSARLKSQKGVNIPNVKIPLPAMTAEDIESISFGCLHDVDVIAASFIRSKEHVLEIKSLLSKCKKPEISIIAKIEDIQGVQNFDEILSEADGIMVARGDLGVELPLQEVPSLQKMMIRKCYLQGKPVVTATQMLESMIESPRPTRAEVSDVANAIYDSTSAVMLSGETAVGRYPIEAVKIMKSIILEAEKNFQYREFLAQEHYRDLVNVSTSVAMAAVKTAYNIQAKAVFAFTSGGFTARGISQFRPNIPILAFSSNQKTYHQMALNWGVIPVDPSLQTNLQEAFLYVSQFALSKKIVNKGDFVVVTAGVPFGVSGTTNMLIIEKIS